MKDKIKDIAKRHGPVVIAAITSAVLVSLVYARKNNHWNAYGLTKDQVAEMSRNPDTTVVFKDQKVMITGNIHQAA